MDEVEAVAQAIEDQLTAEDGWMVGTPALSSMCHDFAQAAIAALDAARGDPVARLIAHMKTIEPDEETAGCPATWADFIQILEGIAARDAALEEAAKVAEKWIEPVMATPHENATYRSIATAIRAMKGPSNG